jgi:hypothetical protein
LPKELLDGLDDLRLLGNDAAHFESHAYDNVGKEEIETGIEFTREVLKAEYQYKALLQRLHKLKKAPPSSTPEFSRPIWIARQGPRCDLHQHRAAAISNARREGRVAGARSEARSSEVSTESATILRALGTLAPNLGQRRWAVTVTLLSTKKLGSFPRQGHGLY